MEETPKKIISRTLSSQVVEAPETAISSGRWEIGQKIPSEQELIELYGVSRNTLRGDLPAQRLKSALTLLRRRQCKAAPLSAGAWRRRCRAAPISA